MKVKLLSIVAIIAMTAVPHRAPAQTSTMGISQLPTAAAPLSGNEYFPLLQSGATRKARLLDFPFPYVPLGTGAKSWTLSDALHAMPILADGFANVDPTGVLDSTVGVQMALNAAAPGSKVYFGGKYYVGNLTVPEHVTVECSNSYPDPLITAGVGLTTSPYSWKGQFKQKTGTTITGGQGGVARGCLFIREGLSLPVTTAAQATTLLTQMSGTGVTLDGASFEFDHVAMFGHNIPISSTNSGGHAISNRVGVFDSIFDNLGGPKLQAAGDPANFIGNHLFPFLTVSVPDAPPFSTPAVYERPNVGLWMVNQNTESRVGNNIILGYQVCVQADAQSTGHFYNNRCEFPPTSTVNMVGFSISGAYNELIGNLAIGYTYPFVISDGGYPDGTNTNTLIGNTAICQAGSAMGFRFVSGRFDFDNNHIQNCTGGPGIDIQVGVLGGRVGHTEFSNVPTKLANASSGPIIVDGFSTTPTVTANYTVLVSDRSVTANGGAGITLTLPTASNYLGRRLTVKTIAAFAVVSASANVTPLAGGAAGTAIVPATAGKWAELESDGTNWKIIAEGAVLGSAALANTGASGHAIPYLDGANTWGPPQIMSPQLPTYTIAALLAITCNAGARGTLAWVNDTVGSAAPAWNAAIAGGGATAVDNLAACNGAAWVYH